jgi:hypothetical protein
MKDLELLKEDFKRLTKKVEFSTVKSNVYEVTVSWHDGDDNMDYIDKVVDFKKNIYEDDFLLQIILSYLNQSIEDNKFFTEFDGEDIPIYGNRVAHNYDIHELWTIIEDYDLYTTNGESVIEVSVKYFDEWSKCYQIELPKIEDLFENADELIKTINSIIGTKYNLEEYADDEECDENENS